MGVRPTRTRMVVGYGAVAGTLPYLGLKVAWLSGSHVGITDPAFADDSGMVALNLLTAGMDLVAVALALALTHRWGLRLPVWCLVLPMWVGTGFLAPIVLGAPVVGIALALEDAPQQGAATLPLAGWVQPLVYGSFLWQGVLLLTAFALHVRARWPRLGQAATPPPTRGVLLAARVGAALAVAAGGVQLLWALGVGLPERAASAATPSVALVHVVHGSVALAAAAGGWALTASRGAVRWPLVLTWAGSSGMAAWGGWSLLAGASALAQDGPQALPTAVAAARLAAGLLLGAVLVSAVRSVLASPQGQGEAHQEDRRDHAHHRDV